MLKAVHLKLIVNCQGKSFYIFRACCELVLCVLFQKQVPVIYVIRFDLKTFISRVPDKYLMCQKQLELSQMQTGLI